MRTDDTYYANRAPPFLTSSFISSRVRFLNRESENTKSRLPKQIWRFPALQFFFTEKPRVVLPLTASKTFRFENPRDSLVDQRIPRNLKAGALLSSVIEPAGGAPGSFALPFQAGGPTLMP